MIDARSFGESTTYDCCNEFIQLKLTNCNSEGQYWWFKIKLYQNINQQSKIYQVVFFHWFDIRIHKVFIVIYFYVINV